MAGVRDKPANLRRGIAPIRGGIIDELNELSRVVAKLDPESGIQSGLGTRLARELNRPISILNARVEAQTGRRGPVVIAKQTKKPIERKFQVAADFNDQPITGIGFPEKGSDAINLDYFRRFLNCDWFEKMFDECIEEDELARAAAAGEGILHAMYGVTYEIPPDADTVGNADCGLLEFGVGFFWQYIIPVQTIVDQVTWRRTLNTDTNIVNGVAQLRIALYDCNQSATAYPIVCKTDPQDLLLTAANTTYTLPLDSRVTIQPGMYALALTAPCFHSMAAMNNNNTAFVLANEAYADILPSLVPSPRYGAFFSDGTMPDQLDSTNIVTDGSFDATSIQAVPMVYFADSLEFA